MAKPSSVGPLAADSAMMALRSFPIDLRNSRMASMLSAGVAQSGTSMATLLGLMTTRRFPIDREISRAKNLRDWKTVST